MKIWNKFLSKRYKKKGYKKEYLKLRVAEHNKNLRVGVALFIFFIMGITLVMHLPYFEKIERVATNIYFGNVANIYKSNTIVVSIAEVCSNLDEEEKQIRCVNNFVKEFFYRDEHPNETKVFRTPLEIINQGGCCRDYTVFYKAIFSVMGYESEFIHEPNHIYLRVFGEENNYLLDQYYGMVEEKE